MWRVPWSFPHGFCLKVQEDLDWECGVCFWCLPKRMTAIDLQVRGMMCVGSSTSSISLKIENNGIFLSTSWSCKISPAAFRCINSILYTLSSQLPAYSVEICTSRILPTGTFAFWNGLRFLVPLLTGSAAPLNRWGNTLKICCGMKTSWVFYSKVIDILTRGSKVEKYLCHLVLLSMTSDRLKSEMIFGSLQFHDHSHSQIFLICIRLGGWVSCDECSDMQHGFLSVIHGR